MSTDTKNGFSREALAELRHRLRTPLNHILGYSEMLLQDVAGLPPTVAAQLREIHANGQEILTALQQFLSPEHGVSLHDIDGFRSKMIEPLHRISRAVGALLESGPAELMQDALRIANGAAELLEFTEEKIAVERHISLRLHAEPASARTSMRDATVLIVDDDEANRDILSRQLQRLGFEVLIARSGLEAIHLLSRQAGGAWISKARDRQMGSLWAAEAVPERFGEHRPFDIALVDFMMPHMDGLDVLEAIKHNPDTRDVPVVMISAVDDLAGVSRCIQRGAEDYLFKPFDPVLLSARISAALERTRLRAQERERTKDLERMSAELQRSNEDLKRFAYAASHDLQAPLRTITTHLQLLERHLGTRLGPEDRELLRFPAQAAMRMNQLIKDLLTYSQVSTEERDITRVSCNDVLASTLEDLSSAIAESYATITNDPLPTVMADRVQLRQLLLNLIGNAIKYRSERPPHIHVSARREFAAWHFTVSDNGVGIPAHHLSEVFNLFKRLHGHEVPGTGLGLSICKRIMERLGGRIWVESEEGKGSVFHFTIPDEDSSDLPNEAA